MSTWTASPNHYWIVDDGGSGQPEIASAPGAQNDDA